MRSLTSCFAIALVGCAGVAQAQPFALASHSGAAWGPGGDAGVGGVPGSYEAYGTYEHPFVTFTGGAAVVTSLSPTSASASCAATLVATVPGPLSGEFDPIHARARANIQLDFWVSEPVQVVIVGSSASSSWGEDISVNLAPPVVGRISPSGQWDWYQFAQGSESPINATLQPGLHRIYMVTDCVFASGAFGRRPRSGAAELSAWMTVNVIPAPATLGIAGMCASFAARRRR